LLANTGLLTASIVVALVVAEIALRVLSPQQLILLRPDLWQPADTVGWLRRPNVDAQVNTGERLVRFLTDHEGFRVGATGRRDGIPVLLLGDSFMEALQVDHEQSLAGLLDRSLSDAAGSPVAVRNAAISGWAPTQYLARARTLLSREQYRLVITVLYVGNDARPERVDYIPPRPPAERHHFRIPKEASWDELVSAMFYPLNDLLEVRSHLFVLLRKQLETLRMRTGTSAQYFPPEFLTSEANAKRWTLTADVSREIEELARAHGAEALFVLVPSDFQVHPSNFFRQVRGFGLDAAAIDLDQPSRRLEEELSARGLRVVNVLSEFRHLDAAGQALYGSTDTHLSPEGHRALSRAVTPVAAPLLARSGSP
jgi:lysophospholipase L1-like esterase